MLPYPANLPAHCAPPGPPQLGAGKKRILANVYELQNAISPSGLIDPTKICIVANPQGADVTTLVAFASLFAVRWGDERLVGAVSCHFVASSIAPISAGTTLIYPMKACDYAPTEMYIPKGYRLVANIGVTFGSAKPMPVSVGPVLSYSN